VIVLALLLAPRWTLRTLARPFQALARRVMKRTRPGGRDLAGGKQPNPAM
jgi:hypothetical protein